MNRNFSHPYIKALFHAMVAEQNDWNKIKKALKDNCDIDELIQLENKYDRAYIIKNEDEIIISISGTKSAEGWASNLQAWPNNGWHYGFDKGFQKLLSHPVVFECRGFKGKVWIFGHSRGSALALRTNYFIRSFLKMNCESITYCGPTAVDKSGKAQCKKKHVCNTTLNIDPRDPVDDVGKLVGGVEYGYIVNMPDDGSPDIHKLWIIDNMFYGHAPSYVCRCLLKLFHSWGKPCDEEINDIKKYAIR